MINSSELSNQIELRISSNTCRISTSSPHVFCKNASLSPSNRPKLSTDRDERKMALDKHTLASEPLYLTSAAASMEDYDPGDEAASSGLAGTLCCRFHKQIDLSPLESWETKQSPPRPDLAFRGGFVFSWVRAWVAQVDCR